MFEQKLLLRPVKLLFLGHVPSDNYQLDLIQRHVLAAAILKLRCSRIGISGHISGFCERPTILQVRRDSGARHGVVSYPRAGQLTGTATGATPR